MNAEIFFIYIKNDVDIIKIVFRYFNLNIIIEYNVDSYFVVYSNNYDLIMKNRKLRVNALKDNFDIKMNNDISICDIEK